MKKILLLSLIILSAMPLFSKQIITVTSLTWKSMYAWIWNTSKKYNDHFIPLQQVNDSTWILSVDEDLTSYKKAGILFTDTDSWDKDMQRTDDTKLNGACFSIPAESKERQIIKMNSGAICRVILFDCKSIKCHE